MVSKAVLFLLADLPSGILVLELCQKSEPKGVGDERKILISLTFSFYTDTDRYSRLPTTCALSQILIILLNLCGTQFKTILLI